MMKKNMLRKSVKQLNGLCSFNSALRKSNPVLKVGLRPAVGRSQAAMMMNILNANATYFIGNTNIHNNITSQFLEEMFYERHRTVTV